MFIFLSIIILLMSFKKVEYKLLIYATINDEKEIYFSDTTQLKQDLCLQINIDTISTEYIAFYSDKHYFSYSGQDYTKSQLYDFKYLNYLKQFKINDYRICFNSIEPPCYFGKGSCVLEKHKEMLKKYIKKNNDWGWKIRIQPWTLIDTNGVISNNIDFNFVYLTAIPRSVREHIKKQK